MLHVYPGCSHEAVESGRNGDDAIYSVNSEFTHFGEVCVICGGPGVLYNLACLVPHYMCPHCHLKWPLRCPICRAVYHPQVQIAAQQPRK